MQRFYQSDENGFTNHLALSWQTAFHEAGHVAAICLENKRKNLPSIYFEIHVGKQESMVQPLFAKVIGGRLIGDLATVTPEYLTSKRGSADIYHYQHAYEADIVNFLAGPLAEAKHIAIRDNEIFNIDLLTPQTMSHYGGSTDMLQIMSYLEFFIPSPEKRRAKLNALFAEAFRFVQEPINWKSITALAHYILNNAQEHITCEEANEVLATSRKQSHAAPDLQAVFISRR